MNRSLFKRQLKGNRWDARIYDWFVQRRYGPYLGNVKSEGALHQPAAGEIHGPGKKSAPRQTDQESFGAKFYVAVAAVPLAFAAYKYSKTPTSSNSSGSPDDTRPYLTRLIDRFRGWEDEFKRRNATHTAMLDVAARDRNLFYTSQRSAARQLANPEVFNTGSPYNVAAGQSIDLSGIIAHYERANTEKEAAQVLRQQRREAEAEASAQRDVEDRARESQMGWWEWMGVKLEIGGKVGGRGGERRRSMGISGDANAVPSGSL